MVSATDRYEKTKQSFLEESNWLRFSSPLFSALVRASAQDPDLIELGSATRAGQHAGMLLPIVVHYLLLQAPEARLSRYFPSLTPSPEPVGEAFPAFRDFCLEQREEVAELLARHTVNTSFVERSSSILATLARVYDLVREPLNLLEICCSVGLNLLFDQYHYDFGSGMQLGREQSSVRLTCKVVGNCRPPIPAIPPISHRVGVDLVKVDPLDPGERLWMQATLFPEWKAERANLDAALAIRARHPLRIIEGDALEALPSLLAEIPGTLCVLHTHCMGYWSEKAQGQLDDLLREASRARDIHRISIDRIYHEPAEGVGRRLAKLATAGVALTQKSFPSLMEHRCYSRSDVKSQVLGQADGFGGWIDWYGSA